MLSLIGWIISGLIIGAIARFLHPGFDRMGMGGTILLGIVGSLVGGAIAFMLHLGMTPYQPGGWIISIIGAVILLWMGFFGTRPRTIY
jgi:uncharacterized membrane protein YeaQ/YmgE (transglycosylase-associated protein family)